MRFVSLIFFCATLMQATVNFAVAENILGPHAPQNQRDARRVGDMISLAEDIETYHSKTGHYPLTQEPQAKMLVVGISGFVSQNPETPPIPAKTLQDALQKEIGSNVELAHDPDEGREGVKLRIYQYATDGQDFYVSAFLEEETFYTRRIGDGLHMLEITSRPNVRDSQYNVRQIKRFLKSGVDDDQKQEALQKALRARDFKAAEKAVHGGANISPICDYFTTCQPLAAAANAGFIDIVEFLVENGADVNGFNTAYDVPLMFSLLRGLSETSKFLLKSGADVNIPNALGETPFTRAILQGEAELVDLMLAHKAKVNTRFLALNGDAKPGDTGPRPLEAAIKSGAPELVERLLNAGADAHLPGQDNATMIQIAEKQGDTKIIKLIKTAAKK